jgi:phosphopantothenoylcysteine decarboxylase/phosphopantothenate--cysteine ligase
MARIILGISGGIAAYKATGLIRAFAELGHNVTVVPTENALRFIGTTTLEALSHNVVDSDLYSDVVTVKHVALGKSADLIVVAPATANLIAKLASGITDDLLTNTILASTAPILVVPAMHTEMWVNTATVANVATLRGRGLEVMDPASGRLTGEDSGPGRLPEVSEILEYALRILTPDDLVGKRFLVTAGGTREHIDPVRFIGNNSSGKQGVAIARAAARRGAEVTVLAANIQPIQIPNVKWLVANTASEMEVLVNQHLLSTDVLVMCAAISDFRVKNPATKKLKRSVLGDEISVDLVANPDILAGVVARIRNEAIQVVTVGFAAETATDDNELESIAKSKLLSKGCDFIVANDVARHKVFDSEDNNVVIVDKHGFTRSIKGNKSQVASGLLDMLGEL